MKRNLLLIIFISILCTSTSFAQYLIISRQSPCSGQCNGSATATYSGGVAPYTYTWQPGGYVGASITNLCPGTYTVYAEDALGTLISSGIIISNPVVQFSNYNNCYGLCSSISQANVLNGNYPFSYLWSNGATTPTVNLCTGNYSVQITDVNGCVMIDSISILSPPPMTISVTQTNTSCTGLCNGSANINVTGGSGSFIYELYEWLSPTTTITSTPTNLCSNAYTVSVTDSITGCVTYSVFNIFSNNNNTIPNTTLTSTSYNESCLAVGNGSIDVTVFGSNPGPFSYLWSNGVTSQDAINLSSNPYWVTISDASGNCETLHDTIFSIDSIPNLTTSLVSFNETCHLSGDGAIDLTISGTNPGPFTYLWSNGATTQDIANISSNIYSVRIMDANSNCIIISDTITLDGINCGSISGNVYFDNNSNCFYDWTDNSAYYAGVYIQPGNRFGYIDPNGSYIVNDLPFGTYTVTANSYLMYYSTTCTSTISTTINSSTPAVTNNNLFVGFNSSTNPDMLVYAYSNGIVPGMPSHVNYYLANINNVIASGIFKVTLPPSFIANITNCSPAGYTISGDTVIWNFNNVGFNFNWMYAPPNFSIEFIPPIGTPLGSIFSSCMYAQPSVSDFNPANNIECYQRVVTGSFDPNDKTVSPVGEGPDGIIDSTTTELIYTIRFQNTGNGPAINIAIKDSLSANLDINTFEMLHASHNYNIDVLEGNVLRWKFNNIMLADSGSNEPASHGFVQYKIKRKNNNTPGIKIKNTAYIYFDFNEPVVTNTTINTIGIINGIKLIDKDIELINVYPNPASSVINIKLTRASAGTEGYRIKIMDVLGREVLVSDYKEHLTIVQLETGIYFVSILQGNKTLVTKKVVKQ